MVLSCGNLFCFCSIWGGGFPHPVLLKRLFLPLHSGLWLAVWLISLSCCTDSVSLFHFSHVNAELPGCVCGKSVFLLKV